MKWRSQFAARFGLLQPWFFLSARSAHLPGENSETSHELCSRMMVDHHSSPTDKRSLRLTLTSGVSGHLEEPTSQLLPVRYLAYVALSHYALSTSSSAFRQLPQNPMIKLSLLVLKGSAHAVPGSQIISEETRADTICCCAASDMTLRSFQNQYAPKCTSYALSYKRTCTLPRVSTR